MGPTLHCHTEGGYGPAPWASSSSIEAQLGHGLSPWPGVHHPTITEGAQRKQYAPKEPKKKASEEQKAVPLMETKPCTIYIC